LEQAAQTTQKEKQFQQEQRTQGRSSKKDETIFDNPIVKQVGRTAASVITRSLLGVLGLGGRRSRSLF